MFALRKGEQQKRTAQETSLFERSMANTLNVYYSSFRFLFHYANITH